jgi:hypothetical protein
MKKILGLCFALASFFCYAETDPIMLFRLGAIIDNGINDSSIEPIKKYVKSIEQDDLDYLFFQHAKESALSSALNFLVGFGVGSLAQGDTHTAKLLATVEITGIIGSILSISIPFFIGDADGTWLKISLISGGLILGSRFGGSFQAESYAAKYNFSLAKLLNQE